MQRANLTFSRDTAPQPKKSDEEYTQKYSYIQSTNKGREWKETVQVLGERCGMLESTKATQHQKQ